MDNDEFMKEFGELKSDVKWVVDEFKRLDKKYAPKWVQLPVYGMLTVMFTWVLYQLLNLIPVVKSFLN